jgi:hypothetical protein
MPLPPSRLSKILLDTNYFLIKKDYPITHTQSITNQQTTTIRPTANALPLSLSKFPPAISPNNFSKFNCKLLSKNLCRNGVFWQKIMKSAGPLAIGQILLAMRYIGDV